MKIEAESNELIVRNNAGDIAIIPKVYRKKALKYLEDGNSKALDELISGLPAMEEYAEDGTLIMNDPPDGTKPSLKDKNKPTAGPANYPINTNLYEKGYTVSESIPEDYGFGDIAEMKQRVIDWRNSYGYNIRGEKLPNPPKFISTVTDNYGRYKEAPNPYKAGTEGEPGYFSGHHCLGSACRASKQFNPSLPTIYDVLGRQLGIVQETTEGETGLPSLDSWEIHQKLEDTGTGTILFNKGMYDKDRDDYITNFDPSQLPLGTIFGHGDATDPSAGYVTPGAKSYRGKKESLPRHSSTLVKYDEATGDMLIYDYGQIKRVAYNRELTPEEIKLNKEKEKNYEDPEVYTWKDFTKRENIVYATKINQAGDYTYKKLKDYKNSREEKVPELVESKKAVVAKTTESEIEKP